MGGSHEPAHVSLAVLEALRLLIVKSVALAPSERVLSNVFKKKRNENRSKKEKVKKNEQREQVV